MKKLLTVSLFAGVIAVLIPACKGKDAAAGGDPKTVLTAFFEKMSKKDIDGATKLCTKDSKATMDMMKKAVEAAEKMKSTTSEMKDDGTEDFKNMVIGEAKIDGDNATVSVTNTKKSETVEFPLKKEGGDWKVDFTMGTLMKMGMDANKNSGDDLFKDNSGTDTTLKNMDNLLNNDSLKEIMDKAKDAIEKIKTEDLDKLKDALKENN